MPFDLYAGVDESGAETPTVRTPALQVFAAMNADADLRGRRRTLVD